MIARVTDAKYLEEFKIDLSLLILENEQKRELKQIVDLSSYISSKKDNGVFAPLKNQSYFKNFTINANTIEWPNGADIAPERLYELAISTDPQGGEK